METNTMIAHQGGWDEILLVAAPLIIFAILLLIANNKMKSKLSSKNESNQED